MGLLDLEGPALDTLRRRLKVSGKGLSREED